MESKNNNNDPPVKIVLEDKNINLIENNYVFSVFAGFVIIGMITKLFFFTTDPDYGATGPASALLWGYSIVSISLLGILFIGITLNKKGNPLEKLISSGLPIILLLLLLLWAMSFNIKHYVNINKGHITNDYYIWSEVSTIIMIFQVVLVCVYVKNIFIINLDNYYLSGKIVLLLLNNWMMIDLL